MAQMNTKNYNFKVVLLGEGCVGKTSIVMRYVEDKFNSQHLSTLQASFLIKKLQVNGKNVHLNIWDTAGQERFHALGPIYYRASNGALLVYDITDQESFRKVKNWVKELKSMLGADVVIVIVGNKLDLEMQRTIGQDEAEKYAETVGAYYCETSAKRNDGIDELFINLTKWMIERYDKRQQEQSITNASCLLQIGSNSNRLVITSNSDEFPNELGPTTESINKSCCGAG